MKKVFFFTVVALIINFSVFAQESEPEEEYVQPQQTQQTQAKEEEQKPEDSPFELHLTFINAGGGMYVPLAAQGFIELLRFGAEHKATGLGAEFAPFHIFGWVGQPTGSNSITTNQNNSEDSGREESPQVGLGGGVSILNLTLYWNLISVFDEDKFYLAPFATINYLIMHQNLAPTEFMFSAGLQAGIRRGTKVKFNVFSVETGMCLIKNYGGKFSGNDGPRFFASIRAGR